MADGEHGVLLVVDEEGDQGEGQGDAAGAPADRPRETVPDGGGGGEGDGGGDHGIGPANEFEQRQQEKAAGGGADEIEEIDAVDLVNGFADGERDDGSGGEKWQGGGEVDEGQVPVGEVVALGEKDGERHDDEQAIDDAETAEAGEERSFPTGHDVGKNAAQSETEKRDGDGEEGEVVVEDDRKNAGEGELQQQGRHGGKSDAKIDLTPLAGIGFHRVQLLWYSAARAGYWIAICTGLLVESPKSTVRYRLPFGTPCGITTLIW